MKLFKQIISFSTGSFVFVKAGCILINAEGVCTFLASPRKVPKESDLKGAEAVRSRAQSRPFKKSPARTYDGAGAP